MNSNLQLADFENDMQQKISTAQFHSSGSMQLTSGRRESQSAPLENLQNRSTTQLPEAPVIVAKTGLSSVSSSVSTASTSYNINSGSYYPAQLPGTSVAYAQSRSVPITVSATSNPQQFETYTEVEELMDYDELFDDRREIFNDAGVSDNIEYVEENITEPIQLNSSTTISTLLENQKRIMRDQQKILKGIAVIKVAFDKFISVVGSRKNQPVAENSCDEQQLNQSNLSINKEAPSFSTLEGVSGFEEQLKNKDFMLLSVSCNMTFVQYICVCISRIFA